MNWSLVFKIHHRMLHLFNGCEGIYGFYQHGNPMMNADGFDRGVEYLVTADKSILEELVRSWLRAFRELGEY